MKIIGWILLILGLGILCKFAFFYDVMRSEQVQKRYLSGNSPWIQVSNENRPQADLLQSRNLGVICGIILTCFGGGLLVFGSSRKHTGQGNVQDLQPGK